MSSQTKAQELIFKPAHELRKLLDEGQISSVELTQATIDRTQATNPELKTFNSFLPEDALAQAQASDDHRAQNKTPRSPLDGIPVSIKDNIAVQNHPLTCSSKILEKYISPYDAHVSQKLKEGGAILWGRTNLDEFAMGSSTEGSVFGSSKNPWNTERTPGGSSGGSTAAVASGQAPLALGSDTGGSIRQPASYCGVVGLKPTYGRVSRFGLAAFGSSLDQIGPIARNVTDTASLLCVIAGHDHRDSTSYKTPVPNYLESLSNPKKDWKIGLPKEYLSAQGLSPDVKQAVHAAIDFYKAQGAEIVEISLPHMHLAIPTYYIVAPAEASSNLARYDGIRYTHRTDSPTNAIDIFAKSRAEGFGSEVKRRIILGTYVLSSGYYDAYYLKAQKVRTLIRNDFLKAFEQVDAILSPTTPDTAFKIGSMANDPLAMYLEDIFTVSANLAGIPAISIPCGFSSADSLPIGLQLMGKPYSEDTLLPLAYQFEQAHNFTSQHPAL